MVLAFSLGEGTRSLPLGPAEAQLSDPSASPTHHAAIAARTQIHLRLSRHLHAACLHGTSLTRAATHARKGSGKK